MKGNPKSLDTKLVHAGEPEPRIAGAVAMPIFQTAQYVYTGEKDYHDLRYIRLNNTPNHTALAEKLASLENAEDALVTASGMAAITTSLLTVLTQGDHLLIQDTLYGGTHEFVVRDLPGFGINYDFIDADDPGSWKAKLRQRTRAIYCESLTNPLLQVGDLRGVVAFAREHQLVSLIDNTFPSPVNYRPPEDGFDLSLHSCTKYMNGHSDLVAGAVIGKRDLVEKVRRKLNHLGGTLDPHTCFLLHRGVRTLALRVRQQNHNAIEMARFLEKNPAVARVNYPGLEAHPRHRRARELFDGFGGMMSFELKEGLAAARGFMKAVRIPVLAPSLGGLETLLTLPSQTSHAGMDSETRRSLGITDGLVRVSIGIEAVEDLLEDFDQALKRSAA